MHGCRILARLLVSHGSNYTSKFAGKSGGFIIMASKLKRFWTNAKLWPICFSILFGYDAANIGLEQAIDPSSLLALFSKRKVAYPESLVIITSMLQHGLRDVMNRLDESDSQTKGSDVSDSRAKAANLFPVEHKSKCVHVYAV